MNYYLKLTTIDFTLFTMVIATLFVFQQLIQNRARKACLRNDGLHFISWILLLPINYHHGAVDGCKNISC